jgi:diacylglycerol kinase
MFATNEKEEAIETAKDFGAGTVVVFVDKDGNWQRIFTAS